MRRRSLRPFVVAGLALIVALALVPGASAAVTIGETFTPVPKDCETEGTFLQYISPGDAYEAPAAGVITSWSHHAVADTPQMKLKVGRFVENTNYLIVGESAIHTMTANELNTMPARISVQAGDIIGFYTTVGACARTTSGYSNAFKFQDQAAGTTPAFTGFDPNFQLDVSAVLEPDADNDGYGDESQDACLGNAAKHELPCTDPEPPGGGGGSTQPGGGTTQPGGGLVQASNGFTVLGVTGRMLNVDLKSAGVFSLVELRAKARTSALLKPSPPALLKPSSVSGGPGIVSLPLKLTAAAKKKLNKNGKVSALANVVFAPTGGTAAARQVVVKVTKPKKKPRR